MIDRDAMMIRTNEVEDELVRSAPEGKTRWMLNSFLEIVFYQLHARDDCDR